MSQGQEICEHWAYLSWTWFQFHGFLMIFGESPTARFLAPKSRSSCTSQCRSRIVKMSWCGFLPTSLSMALMKNLRSEKKTPNFNNYPGTIIRIFPGKARNFLCKGLDIELMKNQGSPCQVNQKEHLCTLRDGALDQARHMWPQGRVQPTEQLPLKTKRW